MMEIVVALMLAIQVIFPIVTLSGLSTVSITSRRVLIYLTDTASMEVFASPELTIVCSPTLVDDFVSKLCNACLLLALPVFFHAVERK